jgi:hypothetical protein
VASELPSKSGRHTLKRRRPAKTMGFRELLRRFHSKQPETPTTTKSHVASRSGKKNLLDAKTKAPEAVCAKRSGGSAPAEAVPADLATRKTQGLPGKLWNQADDQLRTSNPTLLDAYERILSNRLSERSGEVPNIDSRTNEIGQIQPR